MPLSSARSHAVPHACRGATFRVRATDTRGDGREAHLCLGHPRRLPLGVPACCSFGIFM